MMNRRGVTKRTGSGASSTSAPGGRSVAPGGRSSAATPVDCRRPGSGTLVLAERNQAVAAVGAWVEDGHELQQHPFVLALLTEEQQLEVRRQREQRLLQFQQDVLRRVQQAQDLRRRRRRQLLQNTAPQQGAQQRHSPAKQQGALYADGERRTAEQHSSQQPSQAMSHVRVLSSPLQPSQAMSHVRRRLAKCQILTDGEMMSELPGGVWHVSPTRDKPISKTLRAEVETNEEEEELDSEAEDEDVPGGRECPLDVPLPPGGHECPLVRQSVYVYAGGRKSVTFDTDPVNDHHRTGSGDALRSSTMRSSTRVPELLGDALRSSSTRVPEVLWPLDDPQDIKRQQHQSCLVRHRRLYMDLEREQVKERRRQRKHLKRIARIKAEHEQLRQEEERSLDDRERQRAARLRMEERELLILQRLRQEEEERRGQRRGQRSEQRSARTGQEEEEQQRRERRSARARAEKSDCASTEKSSKPQDKDRTRFVEAFRARLKERLPQEKLLDLPPLCCCGEAFWDSHPDTCANNCVFYNNPKAYVRALQSAVFSLDLLEGSNGAPHWMPTRH